MPKSKISRTKDNAPEAIFALPQSKKKQKFISHPLLSRDYQGDE